MKNQTGTSLSLWADTAKVPAFKSLTKDIETDICIIGAGITGLTAAYLLSNEGREVTIINESNIAGGESGRTTAHLSSVIDGNYSEVEKLHGKKTARLVAQSHILAINTIEDIVKKEKINCDFERLDGYLFFQPDDSADLLEKEYDAALNAGVDVEIIPKSPLKAFNKYPSLRFPNQAQFHILKYISALAKAIIKNGGNIFTGTRVVSIEDNRTAKIKTKNKHTLRAKKAIMATNTPISDYVAMHTKQIPYRTYAIGFEIPKNSITHALYWDNEDPYHYLRIQPVKGNDILIIGGEDHKTGQDEETEHRFIALEHWSREHLNIRGKAKYRWSGQILEPIDKLGFIGKDPENKENIFIATGFSGNGMTYGTIAGLMFKDLLTGKNNKWSEIYEPSRITLKDTPEFIKEGIETVSQYIDYITPGDVKDIQNIKRGDGAILRNGLDKIAVYKDDKGKVHKFSAVCPHLKCIVQWNEVEKSWDCPCHGSRFNSLGEVINGPALSDLEKYEFSEIQSKT